MINIFNLLKSVFLFLAAKEKNTFSHAVDAWITAKLLEFRKGIEESWY
jgi:hypothetical protein